MLPFAIQPPRSESPNPVNPVRNPMRPPPGLAQPTPAPSIPFCSLLPLLPPCWTPSSPQPDLVQQFELRVGNDQRQDHGCWPGDPSLTWLTFWPSAHILTP